MILVLVGTNPYSFERLVKEIDRLTLAHSWDVFIQLGNTAVEPVNCEFVRFTDKENITRRIAEADVVITHGGFGSIRDVLAAGKTPVVVPRLQEYNECNDYQLELVRELDRLGKVIAVYDIAELESAIDTVPGFESGHQTDNAIPGIIDDFLRQNLKVYK